MPIQIVDSRKLSAEDNIWLKNLSNRLNYIDVEQLIFKIAQQGKEARIDAYAYVIAYANYETVEDKYMTREATSKNKPGFEQFLERAGLIAKWQQEERQKWVSVVAEKDAEHAAELADKDAEITDYKAEIARLRAELESKK